MTLSPDGGRGTKSIQASYTKARQDAFLGAFCLAGTVRKAAQESGVPRYTVYSWRRNDTQGFRARLAESQEEFGDYLEDIALERIKLQKPNDNPILILAFLNANKPEKYRRDASYAGDAGKDIMAELKKLRKENARSKRADIPTEETEAEIDQKQAVEEAQKILARKHGDTDSTG
jgi:hypothetical protein